MVNQLYTFKNLQDQVLQFLDQSGDTSTGLTLVKYALQTAHNKRLVEEKWNFMLWPSPVPVQFKAGVRNYTLHPAMGQMEVFWNKTAKQIMHETPSRSRDKIEAQEDRYHYESVMMSPVKLPSSVGKVTVTGKSFLTYTDDNQNLIEEEVDGAQTTYNVDTVIGVTNMDLTQTLTIVDAGGNNILSLAIGEVGKQYPQIRLYDDGQTETGYYRFYRSPKILTNDNDIPDIPAPFSQVLIYDALLEISAYNDGTPQAYWLKMQNDWDMHLRQAFEEGDTPYSEARVFHQTDRYEG